MSDDSRSTNRVSRRDFSGTCASAMAMFGFNVLPSGRRGALEKPTVAGIGTGGKGRSDIMGAVGAGFDVAALVDVVDARRMGALQGRLKAIGEVREQFRNAQFFTDYREMFAEMGDRVDAVTVGTPDHHHFHASMLAMTTGKHVYCQKPLTHGIGEARMLAKTAEATGMKTQMGNQAHANDHMRRCVELIRSGVIGNVTEIHAWTNRPIWPQGFSAPPKKEAVPDGINWDQWIGPAPFVDYSSLIAPFAWRGWWDYGTGALGDMACHIMDLGFWAVQPDAPKTVIAKQSGATELSPPINSQITWEFGQTPYSAKDGFRFHWYDGYLDAQFDSEEWQLVRNANDYNHPDNDVLENQDFRKFGSVVIGEQGKLFFNRGKNNWVLRTDSEIDGFEWPEPSVPRARQQNPYMEWRDAIDGQIEQAESHFGHAGPFTETILLGVLAQRNPDQRLKWDSAALEISGRPELKQLIQRDYRKGWEMPAI